MEEKQARSSWSNSKSAEPEIKLKPLSPTTVRHIHAVLRRALGDAVRWGKLQRNPADAADPLG